MQLCKNMLTYRNCGGGSSAVGSFLGNNPGQSSMSNRCPVYLYDRYWQKGVVFDFVMNIERDICPFCKAYGRIHGKKSNEKRG